MVSPYAYEYPRPMVTLDAVVFSVNGGETKVLLIRRGNPPFEGQWALPGGFVEMDETLDAGVARELQEETGVSGVDLEQFYTFGNPGRDPRGRSITVAFMGYADAENCEVQGGDDAAEARWFPTNGLPPLAFDHADIVQRALSEEPSSETTP